MEQQQKAEESILVGVFGYPVHHSKSPVMHNAAFRSLGIDGYYQRFNILPEKLGDAVKAVRMLQFRGVNVTIPHKVAIIKYLDDITREAELIGAVNTIVHEDGRLIGTNTDGIGYVQSLREEIDIDLNRAHVLVLGAGGAARAIATQLALSGVHAICITNRTFEKAEELARVIGKIQPNTYALPMSELFARMKDFTIVINTTSVGMSPNSDESPLPADYLPEHLIVSDLVYNPRQTRLLQLAEKRGCQVHGGIGMLVYQGAEAFRLWTGMEPPIAVMWDALLQSL
ncbi:shikimate dehydrogenase [Fodinisporobacter ferrooxydans]|uniref:Shikimate dehydrogenase (NADP(+)) n=1 Tax=Fodinisporobacter ferrooxydans TaxID=2901836 RepID=A0ABY4CRA9_9BACL|nr:shikimate dehydrogenase [Alicyclobacillaceae bacterium MYW30-H2]